MQRKRFLTAAVIWVVWVFLFLAVRVAFSSFGIWQDVSSGLKEMKIKSVCFSNDDASLGYIGSDKAVYQTQDAGRYWQEVLTIAGQNSAVNFLLADPFSLNIVYAATTEGLYKGSNCGRDWQRIFKGKNSAQRNCLSLAIGKEGIYLGTQDGLFISEDKGRNWHRHPQLAGIEIASIAIEDKRVYLATSEGVFKSVDSGGHFEKVYSVLFSQEDIDADEDTAAASVSKIRQVIIDKSNVQKLYIASDKGVFVSIDAARSWHRLALAGLTSSDINSILLLAGRIFAATDDGVFEFRSGRWQEVYQGMTVNTVSFLSSDCRDNLWAATDKGIYKISLQDSENQPDAEIVITKGLIDNFKDEPSIRQIQEQAIRYAEVQPDKIRAWRRQAALAALMPSISLNYDKTIYGSGSTKINGEYGTAMVGPRDWGVSLSWDISELVWNPDQTSIDSRSKLMVELRDDIVDEVTRLYFERRRLQLESLLVPPKDTREKIDRELRIAELTASIDALTGGYLSAMLSQNQR
jgi:photosystem II stability/assembly factor-like uncharacterized protein